MYDWTADILSGVTNPSPVQHVILNVRVQADTRLRNFVGYLSHLQLVLTTPPVAPLRRVTIRLNSYDGSHIGVGIEQEIRDALPVLRDSGLLEVVLLEQNSPRLALGPRQYIDSDGEITLLRVTSSFDH
ncbi:hypothetical protein GGX14DRAFT_570845 [Mycena pura]|uniref:Uncharacterized protein n=1 Tax=Mycena pura TaxID=153505 RepID=A0AAD6VBE0_9AGAR|nr:hypothetical protein GGX14DRAFT_570845 [Mycena pura]